MGMGPWMNDLWMHGWFGMWIWPLLVIVLIVLLVLNLGKGYSSRNPRGFETDTHTPSETALDVLKKRYAKGEISKEEFG
ncbi:SHOCT domain-containing protein [Desulfomonile tiedjei]|uniref:Putative membrane protein (DUF2078) n=1 Tax=Desulfomonile tiedjei (strain ATCC 49306 / DSM 6799 / DCB-1) TaxID=706587 RepID=I4C5E4_DESTA|nr:SHOCT domain-containing protein [Desulfomonile tiedjei]AFM24785.1 putative membrane protein (DUF2078) [Desulfomonile tiedjei DSM 6799]